MTSRLLAWRSLVVAVARTGVVRPGLFHDMPAQRNSVSLSTGLSGTGVLADKIRLAVEHTWNKERRELPQTAYSCLDASRILPCHSPIAPSPTGVGPNFKSCQPDRCMALSEATSN